MLWRRAGFQPSLYIFLIKKIIVLITGLEGVETPPYDKNYSDLNNIAARKGLWCTAGFQPGLTYDQQENCFNFKNCKEKFSRCPVWGLSEGLHRSLRIGCYRTPPVQHKLFGIKLRHGKNYGARLFGSNPDAQSAQRHTIQVETANITTTNTVRRTQAAASFGFFC